MRRQVETKPNPESVTTIILSTCRAAEKKNNKHKNQTEYSLYAVRGALLLGSAVDSGDEGLALSSTTPNTATVMIVMLKYNYLNRH